MRGYIARGVAIGNARLELSHPMDHGREQWVCWVDYDDPLPPAFAAGFEELQRLRARLAGYGVTIHVADGELRTVSTGAAHRDGEVRDLVAALERCRREHPAAARALGLAIGPLPVPWACGHCGATVTGTEAGPDHDGATPPAPHVWHRNDTGAAIREALEGEFGGRVSEIDLPGVSLVYGRAYQVYDAVDEPLMTIVAELELLRVAPADAVRIVHAVRLPDRFDRGGDGSPPRLTLTRRGDVVVR